MNYPVNESISRLSLWCSIPGAHLGTRESGIECGWESPLLAGGVQVKQGSPPPRGIHPWSQNPTNWSYPGDFFLALELSRNLSWLAGPPVNVSCNIFINSFGSIAETTMVSESKHKLLFPARDISLPEISTLCAGLPQGGGKSGVFSRLQWYTGHFYCPSQCFG